MKTPLVVSHDSRRGASMEIAPSGLTDHDLERWLRGYKSALLHEIGRVTVEYVTEMRDGVLAEAILAGQIKVDEAVGHA